MSFWVSTESLFSKYFVLRDISSVEPLLAGNYWKRVDLTGEVTGDGLYCC